MSRLGSTAPTTWPRRPRGGQLVTLFEVAKAAGVGESTVSRALRGEGAVSARARAKVQQAAEKLGYVPNRIAGSLASAGSRLVAVVVPSLSNIVFSEIVRGAGEVLDASGYSGVFGVTDYDLKKEEVLVGSLLQYRPAAVLLAGIEHTDATIRMLRAAGCRVVEMLDLEPRSKHVGLDTIVGFSNREAGRVAATHLLDCGYRRIGYVGHDLDRDRRAGKRLAGFRQTLKRNGLELADMELSDALSSIMLGKASVNSLLARTPDLEVIYFANDDMAIGGYLHCLEAAIKIPAKLGLFGHNGLEIGQALPTKLSTILTPRIDIGRLSAMLAIDGSPPQRRLVPFTLLAGGTTQSVRG